MKKILKNIDDLILEISSNKKNFEKEYDEIIFSIKKESLNNSLELSLNEEYKRLELKEKDIRLKNLNDANNFLEQEGFSPYTISLLGKKIEPEDNISFLRDKTTTFEDFFETPSPSKIYSCLNDLVSCLQKNREDHPIVIASNAHKSIIEIQPFVSGNWRCARILQNYILQKNGFPPPVFPLEEAELYFGLMGGVLYDRYSKRSNFLSPSIAEKNFNLYLANKILNSAKEIEKRFKKERKID